MSSSIFKTCDFCGLVFEPKKNSTGIFSTVDLIAKVNHPARNLEPDRVRWFSSQTESMAEGSSFSECFGQKSFGG